MAELSLSPLRVYPRLSTSVSNALNPDEAREVAMGKQDELTIRLEDELDKLIKMFAFAREALNNEMFSGMGYKQMGIGDKEVKKLKELTIGMNSVVESKIRYDKAKKQLAASMTPAEEMDAVVVYIQSLDTDAKKLLRNRLANLGIWPWKS